MKIIFTVLFLLFVSINAFADHHKPPIILAIMKDNVELVKSLLDEGLDIDQKFGDFKSPLIHYTVGSSTRVNVLKLLIDRGADVNALDTYNSSVLIQAAQMSKPETIELLVNAGADVNQVDNDGNFPLKSAVFSGDLKTVELLLSKGANINQTSANYSNDTALITAVGLNKFEIVKTLLENGADISHKSSMGDALSIAKELKNETLISLLSEHIK